MKRLVIMLDDNSPALAEIIACMKAVQLSPIRPNDEKQLRSLLLLEPDLVFVHLDADKNWPKGVQKMRKISPKLLPIVGYTENYTRDARQSAMQRGCDTVITRAALLAHPAWQVSLYARPQDGGVVPMKLPQGVRDGIELFNQGKFHECHDAIEPIWLAEKHPIRLFYAAILQIGIAFYHWEHARLDVAQRMFTIGKLKLRHFMPQYLGVNTQNLLSQVTSSEEILQRGDQLIPKPHIALEF